MFFRLSVLSGLAGLSTLLFQGCLAQLQQVPSFGDNPSGIEMYAHVPQNVAENPAAIIAVRFFA